MTSVTDQQRDDDDDDEGPAEPQRSSLAELKAKGKKKAVVPINRANASVGCEQELSSNVLWMFSVYADQRNHTPLLWHTDARGLQFKQPLGPKQNSRLVIFDENKAEIDPQEPKFEIWTAPPTARAKENEQKPEKWSNVKVWASVEQCLTGHMTSSGGSYLIDRHWLCRFLIPVAPEIQIGPQCRGSAS